jgi:hypothetical protein
MYIFSGFFQNVLATPLLTGTVLTYLLYIAHFVFLRDVWIRTQRAALAGRRAINLAPISLISHLISLLSHSSPIES